MRSGGKNIAVMYISVTYVHTHTHDIEVLSVIAQQILTIRNAKMQKVREFP